MEVAPPAAFPARAAGDRMRRMPSSPSRVFACFAALGALALAAQASGCAEGTDLPRPGVQTTTGAGAGTSSSSGGAGGAGGEVSAGGSGGAGGMTGSGGGGTGGGGTGGGSGGAGGAGNGGSGGSGNGGGGGGGGSPTGVVLLFGGGGADLLGGIYQPGSPWTTTTLAGTTSHGVAAALLDGASGLVTFRSSAQGTQGQVMFATWSAGAWSAPAAISASITTQNRPALAAAMGKAHMVFHGNNFNHYYMAYDPAQAQPWLGVESIAASFGPTPPAVTALGADAIAAYAGNNSDLYDHTRTAAGWGAGYAHFGASGPYVTASPTITTLTPSDEHLIVLIKNAVDGTNYQILWTRGSGVTWTAPAAIDATAFSYEPVALAPLPNDEALLVYRGQNEQIYWSRYTPGAAPPWTAPAPLVAATNPTIASTPALARGVDGALAELAYADAATGMAYHARLLGSGWTAPAAVGGAGITQVAIASAP